MQLKDIVTKKEDVLFGVHTVNTAVNFLGLRLDKPERQDGHSAHHHH